MREVAIVCLVIAVVTSGCSSSPQRVGANYRNPDRGFAVSFPMSWELRENQLGLDVAGLAPADGPGDLFRENVTVASSPMPSPLSAEAILDGNIPAMIKAIPDFQPGERGQADLSGTPAAWLQYTQTQDELKLTVILYAAAGKKHAYLLHCTSETGAWEQFRPRCQEVVNSFKVIE